MGLTQSNQFTCEDFLPSYEEIKANGTTYYKTYGETKLCALGEICEKNSDNELGLEFFKLAADKGCDKSIEKIGKYYLEENPNVGILYLKKGASHKSAGCIELLVEYFEKCNDEKQLTYYLELGADYGSVECMRKYGKLLSTSGNYFLAKKYYNKAAKTGCLQSMLYLAYIYEINSEPSAATECYLKVLDKSVSPESAEAAFALVRIEERKSGNYQNQILVYYKKAIELGSWNAQIKLGDYLWDNNLKNQAVEYYLSAYKSKSPDAIIISTILSRLGEYFLHTDEDQAIQYLKEIPNYDSTYPNVNYTIALYYEMKGNTEQMVEHLKKSVGIGSNKIRDYSQVIKSGIKLGEYYSSIDDYKSMDEICKIILSNSPAFTNTQVANLYKQYWENKSHLPNPSVDTLEDIGKYYQSIGEYNLMKKYWLAGIELESVECMELLAEHHNSVGQLDRAVKWWTRAAEKYSVKSMEELGIYYSKEGKLEEMANYYTRAINLGYKKNKIIEELANYYESIGSDELAYKYYLML